MEDWTSRKDKKLDLMRSPRKIGNPMKSIKNVATNANHKLMDRKEKTKREKDVTIEPQHSPDPLRVISPEKKEKRKRKNRKKKTRSDVEGPSLVRTITESSIEIKRVLQAPPEYKKRAKNQYPHHVYLRVAENLFDAMELDKETKKKMIQTIKASPQMIKRENNHMCTGAAAVKMENIAKDIAKFSSYQYCNGAALQIQTAFRLFRAKKEYARVKREWNQKRMDALASLIKREKTYVFNLATVVSQYVMPLNVTADKQLKQIAGDLKLIFSNLEQILSVHQTFLDEVYALTEKDWPRLEGLGDLFISISPHWKAYGIYIHNFKFSRDLLFECINKCEKFSQFLEERTIQLSTDLNMLLSLPLNHIAGYELILKKLLNETEQGSAENTSLLQAVILTEETSNFIANALGKATNVAQVEGVKRTVMDLPAADCLEISKPNSQFIKEMNVEFGIPNAKRYTQGQLILFEKIVILVTLSRGAKQFKHSYNMSALTCKPSETDPRGFSLMIIDEERPAYDNVVEGSQYECLVDTEATRDKLVKELKELIAHNQLTRTFGVPLAHVVERENPKDGVPRVVKDLISYLDRFGLDDLGLFRIPGTSTTVKRLRFEYNQSFITGNYPNLEEMEEFQPNDAAGLLKMFFHDLPEPLIPYHMFNDFLSSQVDYDTTEERLQCLSKLIDSLPELNYRVLKYLTQFMVRVVSNQEVNKMGAENLAMCFGPNILQPEEQTMESTLSIPKTNGCVALMILYQESLFSR